MSEVKAKDKTVIIDCQFPSNCLSYIHWYQQKEGETLKRILYSSISGGTAIKDVNDDSFQIQKKPGSNIALKISRLKTEDSAIYYCACWISDRKVFGSGTRLYVTDVGKDKVIEPTLKSYKPSKIQGDKRTMVCQASKMFPDLVKFTWQTKTSTGGEWANVPDQQVIEQRDEVGKDPPKVFVTSMITVDENTIKNNKYKCSVKHEGTTDPKTAYIDEGTSSPGSGVDPVEATCPPTTENTEQKQKSETTDEAPSLYLFLYAYGIMLMKNGLYFVAVSLYLFKRRFGKKNEST
nr:immunoglobulin kappa light chain-like isoform X2 [Misgurnus anguillicaudatus]